MTDEQLIEEIVQAVMACNDRLSFPLTDRAARVIARAALAVAKPVIVKQCWEACEKGIDEALNLRVKTATHEELDEHMRRLGWLSSNEP